MIDMDEFLKMIEEEERNSRVLFGSKRFLKTN